MLASTTERSFFNLIPPGCLLRAQNDDGAVTVPPTHAAAALQAITAAPAKDATTRPSGPWVAASSQLLLSPVKPHAGACWRAASVPARMTSAWHRRDDDVAAADAAKN